MNDHLDDGLTIREVDASRGRVPVLYGVSCEVRPGRVTAIVGANGAGKSSLLRVVSGVGGSPTRGSVYLGSRDITRWPAWRRVRAGLVHVPEGRRVFGEMSVLENLEVGALVGGARLTSRQLDRIHEFFPILRDRAGQPAGRLSGGEQQMLAIARALVSEPAVLLVDEPSMGLAPVAIRRVEEALQQLRSEGGLAMLIAEQNVSVGLSLADDVLFMRHGTVVETDDALHADPARAADVVLGAGDEPPPGDHPTNDPPVSG